MSSLSQSRVAGARRLSRRTPASGLPPSTSPRGPFAPPPPPTPSDFLGLKANPACGRYDISHCSGAVHGSPLLKAFVLGCHAAVVRELADQVATKRVNGSRLGPSIRGLLRSGTQATLRPSSGWGDWEAGGRAPGNATTGSGRWRALAASPFCGRGWFVVGCRMPRKGQCVMDMARRA